MKKQLFRNIIQSILEDLGPHDHEYISHAIELSGGNQEKDFDEAVEALDYVVFKLEELKAGAK